MATGTKEHRKTGNLPVAPKSHADGPVSIFSAMPPGNSQNCIYPHLRVVIAVLNLKIIKRTHFEFCCDSFYQELRTKPYQTSRKNEPILHRIPGPDPFARCQAIPTPARGMALRLRTQVPSCRQKALAKPDPDFRPFVPIRAYS